MKPLDQGICNRCKKETRVGVWADPPYENQKICGACKMELYKDWKRMKAISSSKGLN